MGMTAESATDLMPSSNTNKFSQHPKTVTNELTQKDKIKISRSSFPAWKASYCSLIGSRFLSSPVPRILT